MPCDVNANRVIQVSTVQGALPTWVWRALFEVNRGVGDKIPLLVIEDGPQSFVLVEANDYNALIEKTKEDGTNAA